MKSLQDYLEEVAKTLETDYLEFSLARSIRNRAWGKPMPLTHSTLEEWNAGLGYKTWQSRKEE